MGEVSPEHGDLIRDRALRLFAFLKELVQLGTKAVRLVDQYEKVLWFNDIPRELGCHCIAWQRAAGEEEAEDWVRIEKPPLKRPPRIPQDLEPWLDPREVNDSSRDDYPNLRERIVVDIPGEEGGDGAPEPRAVFKELNQCPEVLSAWERYMEKEWEPWREQDRRLQRVQKVYTDLYSIYQRQQRLGEAYEVVVGLGFLTWKTPSQQEVKRHIIAAQTSLTFDQVKGVISVGPAGEGAKPTLEQDMLGPQDRPSNEKEVQKKVDEIGDALWVGDQVRDALKAWVHTASPRGTFDETIEPQSAISEDPTIHLAPALILRRRTQRSLVRVYEEIIKQIEAGQEVPTGIRGIVTIRGDTAPAGEGEHPRDDTRKHSVGVDELYFPLPTNVEQRKIAKQIALRQGVLVQGPPGDREIPHDCQPCLSLIGDGPAGSDYEP